MGKRVVREKLYYQDSTESQLYLLGLNHNLEHIEKPRVGVCGEKGTEMMQAVSNKTPSLVLGEGVEGGTETAFHPKLFRLPIIIIIPTIY